MIAPRGKTRFISHLFQSMDLKVYRSTCRVKQISQNLDETMNKCLIFLKLNAWYTLNVLETIEHS